MKFDISVHGLVYELTYAPLVVQIAAFVIIVSVIITFFSYVFILVRRYRGYMHDRLKARLEPMIDDVVINQIILSEYASRQDDSPIQQLDLHELRRPVFRRDKSRQILIDHLMHYMQNMRGINGEMLKQIYLDLFLNQESLSKLKSGKPEINVRGLQEITTMEVVIPDVNILPMTNSKDPVLRQAARNAYLKLSKNDAFKFFDVVTEPILEWDKIELFRIITSTKDIVIPNFAKWITYSSNKTVIDLCIKLAVYYNQVSASDSLIKLLDSHDAYLRVQAINAIGKLKLHEAEDKLRHLYNSQPISCQTEILKALGQMETGNSLEFLKDQFLHANDFDIRKNAARSLVSSRGISKETIKELVNISSVENQKILNHCMNPLILY